MSAKKTAKATDNGKTPTDLPEWKAMMHLACRERVRQAGSFSKGRCSPGGGGHLGCERVCTHLRHGAMQSIKSFKSR
jgi:hypothetical protein